ncbi:beta-galactosidase [Agreia sp. Leaf283]|uniref:beta-galactosidase n=1 Tax=Agreia sp. Leaf283 TaxID=1736321 RepID=UPI0006F48E9E|nr:beta-galactosidase [Agreia sp. Leaf283]KQP56740.1 beta-galactosidase [Agreia sp. Leaf283]
MQRRFPALTDRILFGAAYYAEYQRSGTLDRDLDLMVEAGFTVIRVGESVWSTWEPRDGEFDLEWLLPVLDGAHARGISVILGTPTYAVPPWLQRIHPEIAAENADGSTVGWGQRQEMDYSHPTFRWYAERIIRAVVGRYAEHPAVIGYQVDNEPGQQLAHNHHVMQGFLEWLRAKYGTLENLNEQWGLVYWSHRLSEWADLWTPKGNLQPQYALEWRRYHSALVTEFIGWEADIVREYANEGQFVTTCISYNRPPVSDDELVERLDITAGNPYYRMQDGLSNVVETRADAPWWTSGPWALFGQADRMYSTSQDRFLVTETNAQSIGGHWQNQPPYPGQIVQAGLALVSRGARMIEYWHWHTLHFGVETYWGGVLPHSQRPGRIYREVAELGSILGTLGSELEGYTPSADAAIIWSTDTRWSFQSYPPLAKPDGDRDPESYQRIYDSFYRGAHDAGLQLRVLHDRQFAALDPAELARDIPILFAPAVYVADDALLDQLRAYAEAGGHLVLGPRTGYGDELARARRGVAPDRLAEAAGAWYEEYSNLDAPVAVVSTGQLELAPSASATAWADGVIADGAEVLATYDHHFLGRFAAVTSTPFGAGRITYVGTVPDAGLSSSVARWVKGDTVKTGWPVPAAVSVVSGSSDAHDTIWFVHNWSPDAVTVTAPASLTDLVDGAAVAHGSDILLAPWSVRVLSED